ncbi:UNVERIFIED_CONTAM: hypothetical protein FKN15_048297 [Acipenser sinensis]
MHFNIPVIEEQTDKLGGRFVVYHVYLDGLLYCKMKYSDMHKWDDEQIEMPDAQIKKQSFPKYLKVSALSRTQCVPPQVFGQGCSP